MVQNVLIAIIFRKTLKIYYLLVFRILTANFLRNFYCIIGKNCIVTSKKLNMHLMNFFFYENNDFILFFYNIHINFQVKIRLG